MKTLHVSIITILVLSAVFSIPICNQSTAQATLSYNNQIEDLVTKVVNYYNDLIDFNQKDSSNFNENKPFFSLYHDIGNSFNVTVVTQNGIGNGIVLIFTPIQSNNIQFNFKLDQKFNDLFPGFPVLVGCDRCVFTNNLGVSPTRPSYINFAIAINSSESTAGNWKDLGEYIYNSDLDLIKQNKDKINLESHNVSKQIANPTGITDSYNNAVNFLKSPAGIFAIIFGIFAPIAFVVTLYDRKRNKKIEKGVDDIKKKLIGEKDEFDYTTKDDQIFDKKLETNHAREFQELLKQAGLTEAPRLAEYLKNQTKYEEHDLAIDYHVIFPNCLILNQKGTKFNYNIKIDDDLTERGGTERIASLLGIPYEKFTLMKEQIFQKYSDMPREPDKTVYYVDKFDISKAGIDTDSRLEFRLEKTKSSILKILKKAMNDDDYKIPGISKTLSEQISSIPMVDINTKRTLFIGGIGIHLTVISKDGFVILLKRSDRVFYHPLTWSISVDEVIKGESDASGPADINFHHLGSRGLKEEMGLYNIPPEDIKIFSLAGEYDDLEFSVHAVYKSNLDSNQIREHWKIDKKDVETTRFEAIPFTIDDVLRVILTRKPTYDDEKIPDVFHPDGPRLNLLLLLLREFGREKVKEGLIKYLKTT